MSAVRLGILGSGRGTNAESIMAAVESGHLDAVVAVVISDVSDAPILDRARRRGIEALYLDPGPKRTVLTPDRESEYVRALRERHVDLVVLAGFMRVVKRPLLEAFVNRIVNIHPALLPSFPGLDAWKQAVQYGVRYSGCTVHFVTEHVDGGPIILQAAVPVLDDDTPATLHARIQEQEHRLYPEAIRLIAEGRVKVVGRRVIIH